MSTTRAHPHPPTPDRDATGRYLLNSDPADGDSEDGDPVFDGDFARDLHARYAAMREEGPVRRLRLVSGMPVWVITRHAEARAALTDARLSKDFRRAREVMNEQLPRDVDRRDVVESLASHMLNQDPPDHTRLRKLVAKGFTAKRVEALRPRVEELAAELLDDIEGRSEVDLLDAFAFPLPITVISELLGVADARRDEFRRWSHALLGGGDRETSRAAAEQMSQYLTELIAEKRRHPADDLVSALIDVREEEDRLGEHELIAMIFLLLVAGHETTVNLIGNCVLALLRHPDQFAALRADPGLVPKAIEETLRYDGPLHAATMRYTAEPVRIGDVDIPAREIVMIALGAANRDAEQHDLAEEFHPARRSSGHLAFGHGIHFCLGAALARLEGQIAVRQLVERFPDLTIGCSADDLEWRFSTLIRGLERLPVRPRP